MEPDKLDEIIKNRLNQRPEEKQSDLMKIFEYFVSDEGIMGKTKITRKQRNMLYAYQLMHEKHPTWGLDKAAKKLAHLFISEDGESRSGMIDLFRGLLSQMRQESVSLEVGKQEPGLNAGKR